jgi:hypothetical protein
MTFAMRRRAIKLFNSPHLPKSMNRAHQRKWLKSVMQLDRKWVLHPEGLPRALAPKYHTTKEV